MGTKGQRDTVTQGHRNRGRTTMDLSGQIHLMKNWEWDEEVKKLGGNREEKGGNRGIKGHTNRGT